MFTPNLDCTIILATGKTDVRGNPLAGIVVKERCAVVRLNVLSAKSAMRTEQSASRGNANEFESISVILLTPNTRAEIDDIVKVAGATLRISGREPRFDVLGRLDHIRVTATVWATL